MVAVHIVRRRNYKKQPLERKEVAFFAPFSGAFGVHNFDKLVS